MPQPPTAAEWDRFRSLITELYVKEGRTQKEVADHMRERHSFRASEKMFMQRFLQWAINKKMSIQDAQAILGAAQRRTNAGRRVVKIRLRGHEVTEKEASNSLKRRKSVVTTPDPLPSSAPTPSEISVVSEEDEASDDLVDAGRGRYAGLLMDAVVRQRPESPSLVGDERFETFFVQKMRDWHAWCPVKPSHRTYSFEAYLFDLRDTLYLPSPDTNPRALWTSRQLESVTGPEFSKNGHWLIPNLVHAAVVYALAPKGTERLVRRTQSIILFVAKSTVGDARGHPLVVLCRALFDSQGICLLDKLLRHSSRLCQESFGVGSWAHRTLDAARSDYLREREGNAGEAETILESLMETLSNGSPDQQHDVQLLKCRLANIHQDEGKFRKAEGLLLEVLEYCRQVSRERSIPIARTEAPVPETYDWALSGMTRLSRKQNHYATAEVWARHRFLHCEQAFGTFDINTIRAKYRLAACLEGQEKWTESDALMEEWHGVLHPPQLSAEDDEIGGVDEEEVREDEFDHEEEEDGEGEQDHDGEMDLGDGYGKQWYDGVAYQEAHDGEVLEDDMTHEQQHAW